MNYVWPIVSHLYAAVGSPEMRLESTTLKFTEQKRDIYIQGIPGCIFLLLNPLITRWNTGNYAVLDCFPYNEKKKN